MIRTRLRPAALASLTALVLAACSPSPSATAPGATDAPVSSTVTSPSTPTSTAPGPSATASGSTAVACAAPATATVAQTEGPYFKAGSPERAVLVEAGMQGTPLTYAGVVVDTDCNPIAGAVVDIWQADASGAYDNAGYRLRGHVTTDADGRFTFETIIPGEYPGRTEHIHVKVTPPGGATLTTQMYFPGVAANGSDGIYDASLVLALAPAGGGYVGTFTFVLARG